MLKEYALALGVAVAVPFIMFAVLLLGLWILNGAMDLLHGDDEDE